ncbi:DUF3524 domain-containing protein [bacterium]|nr:DUF3524 domain-containing protein [bacterium]
MQILIIEPFNGGSHAAWAQGYQRHSSHNIEILGLPGRNWKWRMQGAAITLARCYRALVNEGKRYDLIIASDMLDLATFIGLIRSDRIPPIALYFHENQVTYPLSLNEKSKPSGRDRHFGLINFTSALVADICFFNSNFHRQNFLTALPPFLQRFPDYQELDEVSGIEKKSEVLYLGLDLERLRVSKPAPESSTLSISPAEKSSRPPLILWNHRWEYDKNPAEFFNLLQDLIVDNVDFEVAILGEHVNPPPVLFCENQAILGSRLIHFGFAENFADYATWLWRADLLPVTSHHDFFGISVVEAIYCNCYPLLPSRLAYPEHFPDNSKAGFFYSDYSDLLKKVKHQLEHITETRKVRPGLQIWNYDWSKMAPEYDARMSTI